MFTRVIRDVLVPGWILLFGLVALTVPPVGALESLVLVVVGLVAIPAFVISGCALVVHQRTERVQGDSRDRGGRDPVAADSVNDLARRATSRA